MNLQQHEYGELVERWLRDVVRPTIDRHRAHPTETVSLYDAFGRLIASMNAVAPEIPNQGTKTLS